MKRYKTAVTDYEGMQGALDSHAEQGWTLFSVTPDTWRRSLSENSDLEQSPFEELATQNRGTREYSAIYYLLVFVSDESPGGVESYAAAEQPLPYSAALPGFDE